MTIIRPLRTHEDLLACVALQRDVWGEDFAECVPPTLLKASQKIGGLAAGAFDESGDLIGFVFGLTGVQEGRLVHWSHMLGVRPTARGRGIGKLLKEHQRRVLRDLNVESIYWTFDPLALRNAHLNLNRLGARVVEYVPDMYPPTGSPLHGSVATDRFIVAWDTGAGDGGPVGAGALPGTVDSAPVLDPDGQNGSGTSSAEDLDGGDRPALLRIALPRDFEALLEKDATAAKRWRVAVRRGLTNAMHSGYGVAGLWRDPQTGDSYYVLADSHTRSDGTSHSHPFSRE